MPTDIYFAATNLRVKVVEDPGQVAEAFASANDLPFCLTGHDDEGEVYINPSAVAFWSASEVKVERERTEEPAQPAVDRRPVTDIWGKPLRRKPRRG